MKLGLAELTPKPLNSYTLHRACVPECWLCEPEISETLVVFYSSGDLAIT